MANVKVTWNNAEWDHLLSDSGDIGRGVAKAAGRVRDLAKENITQADLVDTGKLRNSIRSQKKPTSSRNMVVYEVGTELPYGIYHEEGTQGPIYPRRAKRLYFVPKNGRSLVSARSVRGVPAVKYLQRALDRLTLADFTHPKA